ncbi:MAG: hypothetical protein KIT27_06905 [Legionellales bacterium]|nr:hypothetical protein [Legionellales bacterium]
MFKNIDDLKSVDWIVIPGGPGMSSNYLKIGLEPLNSTCKLHFYDVYGAPESAKRTGITINDLVKQVTDVANNLGLKKYGLITHSFSNYIALRILEQKDHNVSALLMLSPMPLEMSEWEKCIKTLGTRFTPKVLEKCEKPELSAHDNGVELFNDLMPFYIEKSVSRMEVPFDIQACLDISGQITDYNDKNLVKSLDIPWGYIAGDKDVFFTNDEVLLKHAVIIPGLGHYPFLEDKNSFIKAFEQLSIQK